ncbi:MAG TPA: alpha/beta hydrolase [Dermatophilaceae bacterium]|nr:alpha/beta hydrolase [Dermatophilaceae bacterium]
MRDYRGMSPLTTLTVALVDALDTPVERLDRDGIVRARAETVPARAPFTWVTGPVRREVAVLAAAAPVRDGTPVPLRVHRPVVPHAGPLPVVVHLHGGGWVLGSPMGYDPLCSHLAAELPALVVSVEYRMAPEHPAPTAAHDCVDATRWVAGHAGGLGGDGTRMAVAGDSAGGNLAAVVAQVLRDEGGPALAAQALIYPATDMTMSSPSVTEQSNRPILSRRSMDAFRDHYCPPGTDLTDPVVSPLFGRLDGLPPALVQTADLDPIRDDGIRYAVALRAAGVPARLTNYRRVPHGFASFPLVTPVGRAQRAELVGFLRAQLTADGGPAGGATPTREATPAGEATPTREATPAGGAR